MVVYTCVPAPIMCLGLIRHYWRSPPLGLEVISFRVWLEKGKKSKTNAVSLTVHWEGWQG